MQGHWQDDWRDNEGRKTQQQREQYYDMKSVQRYIDRTTGRST